MLELALPESEHKHMGARDAVQASWFCWPLQVWEIYTHIQSILHLPQRTPSPPGPVMLQIVSIPSSVKSLLPNFSISSPLPNHANLWRKKNNKALYITDKSQFNYVFNFGFESLTDLLIITYLTFNFLPSSLKQRLDPSSSSRSPPTAMTAIWTWTLLALVWCMANNSQIVLLSSTTKEKNNPESICSAQKQLLLSAKQ